MATDAMKSARRAQALVELALGMFALALVVSALVSFAAYMVRSLDMQRTLRADVGRCALVSVGGDGMLLSAKESDSVEIDDLSAEYFFGEPSATVRESVSLPPMIVLP